MIANNFKSGIKWSEICTAKATKWELRPLFNKWLFLLPSETLSSSAIEEKRVFTRKVRTRFSCLLWKIQSLWPGYSDFDWPGNLLIIKSFTSQPLSDFNGRGLLIFQSLAPLRFMLLSCLPFCFVFVVYKSGETTPVSSALKTVWV